MTVVQKIIWTIYLFLVIIISFNVVTDPVGGICEESDTFCQVTTAGIQIVAISGLLAVPTYILHWIWRKSKKS